MEVSIIMSVYNGEKHIHKAIKSVFNQSLKDFEFLIIDDGSTDKSLDIIKFFAKEDNRIKIIRNNFNIGLTKSLNKAIKIAQGEFIARQDVDDISLPNRLKKQANFLKNNLDYAFCGTNIYVMQNKSETAKWFKFRDIYNNLIINNCFTHSSIMIRKETFKKFGCYNEKYTYGQDYELWCRLIYKYKLKAKNLRERLVIMNIPYERLVNKDKKYIIQLKNCIKTKLSYLKYSNSYLIFLKSLFSIFNSGFKMFYIIISNII